MRRKRNLLKTAFILVLVFAIVFAIFYMFSQLLGFDENVYLLQQAQILIMQNETGSALELLEQVIENLGGIKPVYNKTGEVTIEIPAVDQNGNGVTANISVEIIPGKGRILLDVGNILSYYDTQDSARTAVDVAEDFTNFSLRNSDIIFTIRANAPLVGGPSAGAALAVATIAAIEGKEMDPKVMITGQINHDGTIGLVGEIKAKAEAARDAGATLFLVPLKQSEETSYEPKKHCEKRGVIEYCKIEYVPVKIDIGEEAEIEIREVGHISEAVEYMLT